MRSTGIDSVGAASNGCAANEMSPHSSTAACAIADMVTGVFIVHSGALLDLRHQRHAPEPRRGEPAHPRSFAREGLIELGYSPAEAEDLLREAEGETAEQLIASALRLSRSSG